MRVAANELAGKHIGHWVTLGERKAVIEKIESTPETVDIRALSLAPDGGREMFFLSLPATASITIQEGQ